MNLGRYIYLWNYYMKSKSSVAAKVLAAEILLEAGIISSAEEYNSLLKLKVKREKPDVSFPRSY